MVVSRAMVVVVAGSGMQVITVQLHRGSVVAGVVVNLTSAVGRSVALIGRGV